ncbi:hypothetical protein DC498_17675 [Terrimonas sp.]|uniref:hypothetical protein n=1 Tax=Terrimonas sp. TaxID=1914338 RepID=UPI000D512DCF|nr:hypothetical protein [Terrimonas sp.]PVD50802.1 hypothetical protein DC498_17675 [Terrimonas sp.]
MNPVKKEPTKIVFLELKVPLGLPPGKYLVKQEQIILPGIDWKLIYDAGLIVMREATYEEITEFIENNEGGKGGVVCLEYL